MFDFAYTHWALLAVIGLVFLKPHDWQRLAFQMGKMISKLRQYQDELWAYLESQDDKPQFQTYEKNEIFSSPKTLPLPDIINIKGLTLPIVRKPHY